MISSACSTNIASLFPTRLAITAVLFLAAGITLQPAGAEQTNSTPARNAKTQASATDAKGEVVLELPDGNYHLHDTVVIKNRWKGTYLNATKPGVQSSDASPDDTFTQWQIEPVADAPGYFRIKNCQTGGYLNTESGPLVCGVIVDELWSAQWLLEPCQEFYRIKNRASEGYLNTENPEALGVGDIPESFVSSNWSISIHSGN